MGDDFSTAFGGRTRRRIFVISPHPDDDVIGCGGTLARAARCGAGIKVVYVTDGSASHPSSRRFPPRKLRDVREREARSALRQLGIGSRPTFLRAPDGALAALPSDEREGLVLAVREMLVASACDILLTPWTLDPHEDHVATAALVEEALRGCDTSPSVYMYRVWATPPPAAPAELETHSIVVALDPDELAKKRDALLEHRSQTSALIDDDPDGFRIGEELLERWLQPVERFFVRRERAERSSRG